MFKVGDRVIRTSTSEVYSCGEQIHKGTKLTIARITRGGGIWFNEHRLPWSAQFFRLAKGHIMPNGKRIINQEV